MDSSLTLHVVYKYYIHVSLSSYLPILDYCSSYLFLPSTQMICQKNIHSLAVYLSIHPSIYRHVCIVFFSKLQILCDQTERKK